MVKKYGDAKHILNLNKIPMEQLETIFLTILATAIVYVIVKD